MYGRQPLYLGTYLVLTIFNAGAAGSPNIYTLIVLRFLAGAFGSSPLTNAGGVIADLFPAKERGLAMSVFAVAPFLGPVIGPVVGGFIGQTIGWRWIMGTMAIVSHHSSSVEPTLTFPLQFTGVLWIIGAIAVPETYPPAILRARAQKLGLLTGQIYRSRGDAEHGEAHLTQTYKIALSRPWILLLREPIVLLLSLYMAIIYGTLYMLFAAFPIVFQQERGWSPGIGGSSFTGIAVGMVVAVAYSILDNRRYVKIDDMYQGLAPPESRLPPCMVGAIAIPIGLFWFAWTSHSTIHWMVSIAAGAPFGFGVVLVFLSIMNYLIDSYTVFAASALAANTVLRSLFGAAFPLFASDMFERLGQLCSGNSM
jgi:MFS family permease